MTYITAFCTPPSMVLTPLNGCPSTSDHSNTSRLGTLKSGKHVLQSVPVMYDIAKQKDNHLCKQAGMFIIISISGHN